MGANESVEAFPVGRRIAFDAAKGRLWAICPHCGRWNLAPLDERWEALEQCERLFRGTRIRSSTDQIGLARLRDGTELVRIGEPLRPEFAAWRYSSQIALRRRRNLILTGAGIAGATAIGAGVMAAGLGVGAFNILRFAAAAVKKKRDRRIVYRGPSGDGPEVTAGDLDLLALHVSVGEDRLVLNLPAGPGKDLWHLDRRRRGFEGESLLSVAGLALARRNRLAGRQVHIDEAVSLIDRFGNPLQDAEATRAWARAPGILRLGPDRPDGSRGTRLKDVPTAARLALEIAAHEEQERLFLAAHLSLLERAWKEAEAIASIADDLLLPDWIRDRLGG